MKTEDLYSTIDQAEAHLKSLYREYVLDGLKRIPEGELLHVKQHALGIPGVVWNYEIERNGQNYRIQKTPVPLEGHTLSEAKPQFQLIDRGDPKVRVQHNASKFWIDEAIKYEMGDTLCVWEQLHNQLRFYDARSREVKLK